MEKKKFWDTKVGAILKQVAPSAIDLVGDVVPGGKLLKTIFNSEVMNNPGISDEEKVLAQHEFTIALKEYESRERQMVLDDVANARAMQTAALGQGDLFGWVWTAFQWVSTVVGFLSALARIWPAIRRLLGPEPPVEA
jgi:hypothetical protein